MSSVRVTLHEVEMEAFIKELLSLVGEGTWKYVTLKDTLEIRFKGNGFKVQKAIYDWLNVPARKHNFELQEKSP